MAGFPCRAFLALYLTAIVILQGADLSVESKATRDATMPSSNASDVIAKPPRINSAHNGKARDHLQVNTEASCPNCNGNNEKDDDSQEAGLNKLRIEMIKEKIRAKLQMKREPVLKEKPNESKLAALLTNLKLIGQENDENQPEDSEDEYYGKTTKMIVFSEKAKVPSSRSKRNSSRKLIFQFKLEQSSLSSSVPSAFLWLHMRKSKRHQLNGKLLHIEALNFKTESEDIKVMKTRVKKEKKSGAGWIVVDVKDILQHWFNKTAPYFNATERLHTLEISCQDCETEVNHLISSRGRLRPLLVIDLEKPKTLSRRRRQSIDCGEDSGECCRRRLFVNFTKIGWNWILYPSGFYANYCEGSCQSKISPLNTHSFILQELSRNNKLPLQFSICCTPSKLSPLSLVYFDDDANILKTDLSNMMVSACGCS